MIVTFKAQAANESICRHRAERVLCYLQNLVVHIDGIGFLIYLSRKKKLCAMDSDDEDSASKYNYTLQQDAIVY